MFNYTLVNKSVGKYVWSSKMVLIFKLVSLDVNSNQQDPCTQAAISTTDVSFFKMYFFQSICISFMQTFKYARVGIPRWQFFKEKLHTANVSPPRVLLSIIFIVLVCMLSIFERLEFLCFLSCFFFPSRLEGFLTPTVYVTYNFKQYILEQGLAKLTLVMVKFYPHWQYLPFTKGACAIVLRNPTL